LTTGRAVAIFGSAQTEPGSPAWIDAEKTGARCAGAGLTVVTGGYGGTMEAASKGAAIAGGAVIGITVPTLFTSRSAANPYVTREIHASSLVDRLGMLMAASNGAIALPGSIGTATELAVAWNINHVARRNGGDRLPTVAVGAEWGELAALLVERVGAFSGDIEVVADADSAVDWLLAQPEIR